MAIIRRCNHDDTPSQSVNAPHQRPPNHHTWQNGLICSQSNFSRKWEIPSFRGMFRQTLVTGGSNEDTLKPLRVPYCYDVWVVSGLRLSPDNAERDTWNPRAATIFSFGKFVGIAATRIPHISNISSAVFLDPLRDNARPNSCQMNRYRIVFTIFQLNLEPNEPISDCIYHFPIEFGT